MLEAFAYKKYKKHKENKAEALSKHDEMFIRRSIDDQPKTSLFNFARKRKSVDIPPTSAEQESIKKDGTFLSANITLAPSTPTSQEQDLANVMESLNLAIEKVTPNEQD